MRSHLLVVALAVAACLGLVGGFAGCGQVEDVHETPEARNNPCVSCHRAAYEATANPKHEGLFGETCGDCHSTKAWVPAKLEFHDSPSIQAKPCVECHKEDYDATSKPKHAPLLPELCQDCHTTRSWVPLLRNVHESDTVKTTVCSACHIEQYNAATNPKHQGVFPTQCAGCHGTDAWRPAVNVSHDWFPLNHKHATLPCTTCHTNGFQSGATPNTCVGCHKKSYDAATNPSHAGFPTDCTRCHDDAGWRPFFHGWPKTGKHETTPCASCHSGNPPVYAGTPRECVGCHRDDYDRSPFPGHSSFSTVCTNCHTTSGWKPALGGAHPNAKFPISSGAHSKFTCVDCHDPALGPSTGGKNTDCIGCHTGQHRRTSMDAKHRGVRNYPTGAAPPNFCLTCHPDGRN